MPALFILFLFFPQKAKLSEKPGGIRPSFIDRFAAIGMFQSAPQVMGYIEDRDP
jgi:hypothetical protein